MQALEIVGKDSISVEKRLGIWNTREKNSKRRIDTTIQRLDQTIVISRFIEKKKKKMDSGR